MSSCPARLHGPRFRNEPGLLYRETRTEHDPVVPVLMEGDAEAVPELIVVLGGGNQPTAEWLGNALRLMLTDDRFSTSSAGARSSVRDALDEVLWEDTPTQIYAGRYALQDVELGGQLVRRGDMILLGLSGANRDPLVHPGNDDQGNHAHLSFSHGPHRCPCPAQETAEAIVVTAIEVLLDRIPEGWPLLSLIPPHPTNLLGSDGAEHGEEPHPDTFDLTRTEGRHISFGYGPHVRPGSHPAHMEGEIALPMLFERFPTCVRQPSPTSWRTTPPSSSTASRNSRSSCAPRADPLLPGVSRRGTPRSRAASSTPTLLTWSQPDEHRAGTSVRSPVYDRPRRLPCVDAP